MRRLVDYKWKLQTFLNKYFQNGIITQTLALYTMMRMAMSQQNLEITISLHSAAYNL